MKPKELWQIAEFFDWLTLLPTLMFESEPSVVTQARLLKQIPKEEHQT